jgi:RNA polymerase sigma factor (sigma-70 family)
MASVLAERTSKTLPIMDEMSFVKAILNSNQPVLRHIYAKFLPPVANLIKQHGGTHADALDVFQDALIIIFEKAQKPDFQLSGSFFSYLYGVCRNVWGNKLQKKDNQTVTIDGLFKLSDNNDLHPHIERQEKEQVFWMAFEKLGKDCRLILQLFFEGHSMEEICSTLGQSSVGYTKKRKFHCKEALIQLVKTDPKFAELVRSAKI